MALTMKEHLNLRNLVIVSPLFLLTIKGWISSLVVIFFCFSMFFFKKQKYSIGSSFWHNTERRWIATALFGPLLAVIIAQVARLEFNLPNIDLFLRTAFSSIIFLAISKGWLQDKERTSIFKTWTLYIFPLCLIWTFLDRPAWTKSWGDSVVTTYFVDPLTFGSLCLLFTLMTISSLTFYWNKISVLNKLLCLTAILSGMYLAAQSGSRTGWANLPLFMVLWVTLLASTKLSRQKIYFLVTLILMTAIAAISAQPFLVEKILLAVNEIKNYRWSEMNPDQSVTMRISFLRMGVFYFLHNPLSGWGDLGWTKLMDSPELMVYASEYTRLFPKSGFHNEVITSAVRSGVWGLVSSIFFFAAPIYWSIKNLKSNPDTSELYFRSFVMLIYMLHLFISAMTTEVLNLIFLASFHGFIIAVVIGEAIYKKDAERLNKDESRWKM